MDEIKANKIEIDDLNELSEEQQKELETKQMRNGLISVGIALVVGLGTLYLERKLQRKLIEDIREAKNSDEETVVLEGEVLD